MSIIKFTVATVSGALNKAPANSGEINVGKDKKATVALVGYIGAPREKQSDGSYKSTAYGRLSVKAAIAGDGEAKRYVLEIEGGLRGVLFPAKNKKDEKAPDYNGNIDLGDGTEMGLFGRKQHSENGDFISLSSTEAKAKQEAKGKGGSKSAPAPSFDDDGDIPF